VTFSSAPYALARRRIN